MHRGAESRENHAGFQELTVIKTLEYEFDRPSLTHDVALPPSNAALRKVHSITSSGATRGICGTLRPTEYLFARPEGSRLAV
jgi:hypothetical protein